MAQPVSIKVNDQDVQLKRATPQDYIDLIEWYYQWKLAQLTEPTEVAAHKATRGHSSLIPEALITVEGSAMILRRALDRAGIKLDDCDIPPTDWPTVAAMLCSFIAVKTETKQEGETRPS